MKNYVFALLSIGFIIYGCNKDDDDDNKNNDQEKIQLITSATWKYENIGVDSDKDNKPDQPLPVFFPAIEQCEKDNNITFRSDSTGTFDEGATKCDPSDPQSSTFKWWFKENGTVLYSPDPIFNANVSGDFKVGELTSTRLRLVKDVSSPLGTITVVLDLKH